MSIYRLDKLLAPRSVAVVGASPRPGSLGRMILRNLREAGFGGAIHLVNTGHAAIDGFVAVKTLDELPAPPDVVVITVPPPAVPAVVRSAATIGCAAAIIITAGLGHGPGSLADECEKIARARGLRLVGPNCLGVMAPHAKFNASFATRMARAGDLALVSQSGAIAAGMIEWAAQRAIGFSAVVSIGDQLDVDFGDCLDFFATRSGDPRHPALCRVDQGCAQVHVGRARGGAHQARRGRQGGPPCARPPRRPPPIPARWPARMRSTTLRSAAPDCCACIDLGELFDAAETLGPVKKLAGKRLAILTNGGGIGVLAVDRLVDLGGTAAELSAATRRTLDARLAADVVQVESGRHRRGCGSGPLRGRARGPHGRSGHRRRPGDERADRARAGGRDRIDGRRIHGEPIAQARSCPSRCSPPGSAPAKRSPISSTRPAFRIMRPRPMQSADSCIWSAMPRRSRR